jgi:N-sulfoglucosamine sulfohydrolase
MRIKIKLSGGLATGLLFLACFFGIRSCSQWTNEQDLPNILWIVSEDNSAYFTGCYGNSFTTTPHIDKLASEGFLYTHAYCPNAVCAPSRNTLLTGVYSSSNGNENMRSTYALSEIVRAYPEYLHEAGYYCTNNSKTDYNTDSVDPDKTWDESSRTAHYKNRPEGKPFFAVFNSAISHESCLFGEIIPNEDLRHDPAKITLPPYHPDTPGIRHDWAQYYDCIEDMDTWVGQLLQELEENGLAENTIVFYYGDNGGVLPRSKRFVYETGTQIPLVIRIPEKYKKLYPVARPGNRVDRLVNFVDFVPTLLSIAGVPIPEYLQGDGFLGKQKTKDPKYTFMSRQRMDERYDHVRAIRDKQYRYIRNYMPFRITMQHVNYLFNATGAKSWEEAFLTGKTNEVQGRYFREKPVEELYDTENDPWEVHNLATDAEYADVLKRMRGALDHWRMETRDAGVIPETEYERMAGDMPLYDYLRSGNCPFEKLLEASDLAVLGGPEDIDTYVRYLQDESSAVRYWGATGLLVLKDAAQPAIPALKQATGDESGAVATLAAETLYRLGERELALATYIRLLDKDNSDEFSRTFTLNSIDAINESSPELKAAVLEMMDEGYSGYDARIGSYLLEKWNEI